MRPGPVTTPGFGGYLVAWAVSLALVASLLPLVPPWATAFDGDSGGYWSGVAFFAVFAGAASVFLAPPGLLAVHVACRGRAAQWVHVLAAGLYGLLVGILVDVGLFSWEGMTALALTMAASTATGRAVVIPLVERRQELLERRASPSALPVDDDYRAGPPAR